MKRLVLSAIVAGLGFCAALLLTSERAAPKAAEPAPDAEKILALQKERRDLLREAVTSAEQAFRGGVLPYATVSRATANWLSAELDLAGNRAERIAIREKILAHTRDVEGITAETVKAALANHGDLLEAKAARLQAEIELLRERAKD